MSDGGAMSDGGTLGRHGRNAAARRREREERPQVVGAELALVGGEHLVVHRLKLCDRLADAQEEGVRPVDGAGEGRLVLGERRRFRVRLEEGVDVVELALVPATWQ